MPGALLAVKHPCFAGKSRIAQTWGQELSLDDLGLLGEGYLSPSKEVTWSRKGGRELIGAGWPQTLSSGLGIRAGSDEPQVPALKLRSSLPILRLGA